MTNWSRHAGCPVLVCIKIARTARDLGAGQGKSLKSLTVGYPAEMPPSFLPGGAHAQSQDWATVSPPDRTGRLPSAWKQIAEVHWRLDNGRACELVAPAHSVFSGKGAIDLVRNDNQGVARADEVNDAKHGLV